MEDEFIKEEIAKQLKLQLNSFFAVDFDCIKSFINEAYIRCMKSISVVNEKYLRNSNGLPKFSIYHSSCWAIYLYYLSNTLYRCRGGVCADQVYYLNKILHGVDWYYKIELPEHFMVEHPLGSVLGRAKYGDYLYIYQGVTIGGNIKLSTGKTHYPILGDNVLMYSNAKILGDSHIGNNVILSANTYVIDENIPDNSVVFGQSPNLVIKNKPYEVKLSTNINWIRK